MHIKNLVFLFLLCPALLLAVIIETPHFSEIEKHFEKGHPEKMILLCDLDNTLFKADHHLGSIAWCDHVKAELIAKGMSKKEAQEIEDIYLKTIRPYIKIRSVDPQSPSILEIEADGS